MRSSSLANGVVNEPPSLKWGGTLRVHVAFDLGDLEISPVLGVVCANSNWKPLFGNDNRTVSGFQFAAQRGRGEISCQLSSLPLMPGRYVLDLWFGDSQQSRDCVLSAMSFQVGGGQPQWNSDVCQLPIAGRYIGRQRGNSSPQLGGRIEPFVL